MQLGIHFQDWQGGPFRVGLRALLKEIPNSYRRAQHDNDLVENAKAHDIAWKHRFQLAWTSVMRVLSRTVFLGHVCVHSPRGVFGDIK